MGFKVQFVLTFVLFLIIFIVNIYYLLFVTTGAIRFNFCYPWFISLWFYIILFSCGNQILEVGF